VLAKNNTRKTWVKVHYILVYKKLSSGASTNSFLIFRRILVPQVSSMFLNLAKEIVVKVGAERKCSKLFVLQQTKWVSAG